MSYAVIYKIGYYCSLLVSNINKAKSSFHFLSIFLHSRNVNPYSIVNPGHINTNLYIFLFPPKKQDDTVCLFRRKPFESLLAVKESIMLSQSQSRQMWTTAKLNTPTMCKSYLSVFQDTKAFDTDKKYPTFDFKVQTIHRNQVLYHF
jgi:hypothetical protein